ncbi:unnamed protein product [Polarella glacialis]|uniref:WW domain-containing protein n=1 Tax=Polarella glacialis TaxID=89957 RepID=A0A813F153_POLGL|nr:unnamed protein product [Polarella glacialis]
MADFQFSELDETLTASLKSSTIEWAMNMRVCDLLQANPVLVAPAVTRIDSRLRKDSPVSVLLALSLLEILVKNCGFLVCRAVDEGMAETLVALVKKRDSWKYGLGRNLHKSGFGSWLPQGVGIGEDDRQLWLQASQKVLELLQLCVDAFLLQEGELQPVFGAYKRLRQEGYTFPRSEHGVSAGVCLVQGAEESPAFLAGAAPGSVSGGATVLPERSLAPVQAAPEAAPEVRMSGEPFDLAAARNDLELLLAVCGSAGESLDESVEEVREDLLARLRASRERASLLVEELAQASEDGAPLDEKHMEDLLTLVEDICEGLFVAGAEEEEDEALHDAPAVPPPPSEAPPDREQQELHDAMLARYLQAKWDALDQAQDAAMARRLALGGSGLSVEQGHPRQRGGTLVPCASCAAPNELRDVRGVFVCGFCGLGQHVPGSQRPEPERQARHAPPARVMCGFNGERSELMIGGGSSSSFAAPEVKRNGPSPGSRKHVALDPPLFGSGSEALLENSSRPKTSWQHWAKSVRSSASSTGVKRLGDGVPSMGYRELAGGDELSAAPLCGGGGPPASRASKGKIFGGWRPKSSKASSEGHESLLERVQVDGEWELIRPSEGRPYWYNSSSQVSQWEPPDVVRQGGF